MFRIITDQNARTQDLRAGDIQVHDRVQATDVPTLQKDKTVTVIKAPTIGYQGLTFNIGNKNGLLKPYANVGTPLARSQFLRTAFDLALDRKTINKVVFNGLEPARLLPDLPGQPVVRDHEGPAVQPARQRRAGEEARQGIRASRRRSRSR